MNSTTKLQEVLLENGFKLTSARMATFEALSLQHPVAVADIIRVVGKRADRVSVYRTLHIFEELGIVHRIYFGWKYKYELSDMFTKHHHHISCISCGKIVDINDEVHIKQFIDDEAQKTGFRVIRHFFEIEGLCLDCTAKESKSQK